MSPERIGDMNPKSSLNTFRDASGDVVVQVYQYGTQGRLVSVSEVEFCTIGMGGSQSPRTFDALLKLIEAIEEDNKRGRDAKLMTILEDAKKTAPSPISPYTSNFPSEPE